MSRTRYEKIRKKEVAYWVWAANFHMECGYEIARVPECFLEDVRKQFNGPIETIEAHRKRVQEEYQAYLDEWDK